MMRKKYEINTTESGNYKAYKKYIIEADTKEGAEEKFKEGGFKPVWIQRYIERKNKDIDSIEEVS